MENANPFRCFDLKIVVLSFLVAAWLVIGTALGREFPEATVAKLFVGVSQALAVVLLAVGIVRSISQLGELERLIHLKAGAFAGVALTVLIVAWSFLERAGLPSLNWSIVTSPVFVVLWTIGVGAQIRTYS